MSKRAEKIRKLVALANDKSATAGEAAAASAAIRRLTKDYPVLSGVPEPEPEPLPPPRGIDATKLVWRTAAPSVLAALERAIGKWKGTPYRVGQQTPRMGVDCVRFVCGVLDDVTGRKTPIETLPQDAAMHTRHGAIAVMKRIKLLYEPNAEATDGTIESGDLLITALPGGGPGHVLIAGAKPWHLWESTATGVRRTGLGGLTTGAAQQLHYIYRITNKQDWR